MKKIIVLLASTVLILASCTPSIGNEDEVVQNEDENQQQQNSIVSSQTMSEETYRTILPYRTSPSRGVITNQMGNRVDIDEMETGLRRLSKQYYDPGELLFEEGQHLTSEMLYRWLDTKPTQAMIDEMEASDDYSESDIQNANRAINPPLDEETDITEETASKEDYENNPKYLSHILEHNFLERKEDDSVEVVGASIGIALKSVFTFEVNGNTHHREIPESEMMEQGKAIAQTVLERVRNIEELSNVPIMIALYREEQQGSPVPGNFVAQTGVESGQASIDEWESVNEENILFPSDEGEERYYDTQQLVQNFSSRIQEYFPNYVGVVGKGFYIDEELQQLKLEIPIEFYSEGEVLGFTQYTYGLIDEMFQDYYDLEVKITSSKKLESIITREAGSSEANVQVFN
ncbi:Protein involved in sex pheromone biosynthesis [Lentibacillus persicus]|uniref:Protein involved in sex pheromone biosynthesis n=1 Tax=Lentibacillus persicus TaxID=640948 RepID=A0A1I1Z3E9_9BACI|nr:CamS family sex pheromone protein [Lentibacillus persicus]SFE26271.1 Protein involved in sex pheromone biosynthesis [Lentibacillus persicus]